MPLPTFEPWNDLDVLYVCMHMRNIDYAEIFARRQDPSAIGLFCDLRAMRPSLLWFELVRDDLNRAVALFGVALAAPGVGIAHMWATDDLRPRDTLAIRNRIRDQVIPAMIDAGLHRVECDSLSSHVWAHRFLKSTGATPEATRRAAGQRGEDFITFVWLKPEKENTP